jgi:uncharacterized membrane protein (UPF0127 family)
MSFSRFSMVGVVTIVVLFLTWCTQPQNVWVDDSIVQKQKPQVCLADKCRRVEVADEWPERQQWMMNRTELAEDAGMLFIFKEIGARQFWMKDTLIPLDIIWMDGAAEVVHIESSAPPCPQWDTCPAYGPTAKNSLYVLELNAGQAELHGITLGSKLTLVGTN